MAHVNSENIRKTLRKGVGYYWDILSISHSTDCHVPLGLVIIRRILMVGLWKSSTSSPSQHRDKTTIISNRERPTRSGNFRRPRPLTEHANNVPLRVRLPSAAVHVIQHPGNVMSFTDGGGQQTRASQLDGDQHVQHSDDRHRQYEEQDGRNLEGMLDQRPPQRAYGAIQVSSGAVINDAELDGLWHGEAESQQPDGHHELHRSG